MADAAVVAGVVELVVVIVGTGVGVGVGETEGEDEVGIGGSAVACTLLSTRVTIADVSVVAPAGSDAIPG